MRMRMGECRVTRRGVKFCRTPRGVRFVGSLRRAFRGARGAMDNYFGYDDDLAYADGYGQIGRGRPMRMNECRRTSRGVKYCRTRRGVRFQRG